MNTYKTNVAIIGNGMASTTAIETLRKNGFSGSIDVYTDCLWQAYNPMLTTYYLSEKMDFEGFFPHDTQSDFYTANNVTVHFDNKAVKLDVANNCLHTQKGDEVTYEKCLIANGAKPFVPPIPGYDGDNVFAVRTVDDVLKIKSYLKNHPVKKALVIGASMVGIKVVEFFIHENIECCLADGADRIFPLAAHKNCSDIIQQIVSENGVTMRFNGAIQKLVHTPGGTLSYFSNDPTPESSDIVIMAIGVRPSLDFIKDSGIAVDRAILVDTAMQTNIPNVFAAGDCTAGYDLYIKANRNVGLLANARYQGKTAALNMMGIKEEYPGGTPHNITYFFNTDFIGLGDPNATGNVFEQYDKDVSKYIRIVTDDDKKLLFVNLINYKELSSVLKNLFFRQLDETTKLDNSISSKFRYDLFTKAVIKKQLEKTKLEQQL